MTQQQLIPGYLSVKQAALALGVSRRRVQQLAKKERIAAVKVGRDYLFTRAAVEAARGRKMKPGPAKKVQNSS